MHFKMCFQGCHMRHLASPLCGWWERSCLRSHSPGWVKPGWALGVQPSLCTLDKTLPSALEVSWLFCTGSMVWCIHLSATLISSNLFNCLGYSVNIICVHDFIRTGMMYIDHSQTWQMTDALICWSRATPESSSLNQSALRWRSPPYTQVFPPPPLPLPPPVSTSLWVLPSSSTLLLTFLQGLWDQRGLPWSRMTYSALSWIEQKVSHFLAAPGMPGQLQCPALLSSTR